MAMARPDDLPAVRLDVGPHRAALDGALARLSAAHALERLWSRDPSLWPGDRAEIAARLGWLDALGAPAAPADVGAGPGDVAPARFASPIAPPDALAAARALAAWAAGRGLTHAAVIGMGGSSLAPEVFGRVLGTATGLAPAILDGTHPDAVRAADAALDPLRTLFVVSSKSGTTVETASLARHELARVGAALAAAGPGAGEAPGERFVAVTDPGSALAEWAAAHAFRAIFDGPPDVGGRFSALTPFGLVPAALFGADVAALRGAAARMARACGRPGGDGPTPAAASLEGNPAALLGAALAAMAGAGRAALTLVVAPALAPLGDWIEQLVAESTGKAGTGILPVVGEALGPPAAYGPDRLFVHVRARGDDAQDAALARLAAAGHPVLALEVADAADVGGQMALWMLATALAGHLLGVQPFDQPDVESAKRRAREALARGEGEGAEAGGAWRPAEASALAGFVDGEGDYVAVLAWLPPSAETGAALARLRAAIAARTRRPVAVGYGPRYLHSTGQLHKGDAGRGRFVALLAPPGPDVAIPGDDVTFGRLMRAQADGDLAALGDAGRATLALRLAGPPAAALEALAAALERRA